uniref:Mediator of RNA polymerase II transcription subunit 10 n=1 Tax=Oryza meridionalis TaxID=40149 RepID=A0A0E0EU32_9ORYZ
MAIRPRQPSHSPLIYWADTSSLGLSLSLSLVFSDRGGMDGGAGTNASGVAAAAAAGNGVQAGGGGERAEDASKQNLALMMASIQRTLGLLHQLNLNVSSFSSASQLPLLQRLNSLVAELDTMQKHAEGCNIQVPMEVVNLIDDGKNPDEFTRDVLNSCIAKNQVTKGKTDAFKSLRKHLLVELEQAFPEDVEAYREIRATAAAESKRLAQSQSALPNGDVKVKPEH